MFERDREEKGLMLAIQEREICFQEFLKLVCGICCYNKRAGILFHSMDAVTVNM